MFKELFTEETNPLVGGKFIKTKSRTASSWYSPNTKYKILSVDDGFYSKNPGITTEGGFIPLKDLDV